MKVVVGLPPMFDEIAEAFPLARNPHVIFAWGDTIYSPGSPTVSPALMAHEAVHGERQIKLSLLGGVEGWWRQYIACPQFRLGEEIPAHQAEYHYWRDQPNAKQPVRGFRTRADWALVQIAGKLASPLYGFGITTAEARRLILN